MNVADLIARVSFASFSSTLTAMNVDRDLIDFLEFHWPRLVQPNYSLAMDTHGDAGRDGAMPAKVAISLSLTHSLKFYDVDVTEGS
jgi:hypothetical protein